VGEGFRRNPASKIYKIYFDSLVMRGLVPPVVVMAARAAIAMRVPVVGRRGIVRGRHGAGGGHPGGTRGGDFRRGSTEQQEKPRDQSKSGDSFHIHAPELARCWNTFKHNGWKMSRKKWYKSSTCPKGQPQTR
jgi:hypothetical protein